MICQGVVPEHQVAYTVVVQEEQADGSTVEVEKLEYKTVPEAPCTEEATIRSQSLRQAECDLINLLRSPEEGLHWIVTDTHVWCTIHAAPGRVEHLNGTVSWQPVQAI